MNPIVWILAAVLGLIIAFIALVMLGRYDILFTLLFGMGIGYYARMRQKAGRT